MKIASRCSRCQEKRHPPAAYLHLPVSESEGENFCRIQHLDLHICRREEMFMLNRGSTETKHVNRCCVAVAVPCRVKQTLMKNTNQPSLISFAPAAVLAQTSWPVWISSFSPLPTPLRSCPKQGCPICLLEKIGSALDSAQSTKTRTSLVLFSSRRLNMMLHNSHRCR